MSELQAMSDVAVKDDEDVREAKDDGKLDVVENDEEVGAVEAVRNVKDEEDDFLEIEVSDPQIRRYERSRWTDYEVHVKVCSFASIKSIVPRSYV